MSAFSAAAGIDLQTLGWILTFVADFERTYGRYPTADELRRALVAG
jgi:hypothetical protein